MGKEIIAILIIVLVIGLALLYVIKAKKKGMKCIGCPNSSSCANRKGGENKNCNGDCTSCSCSSDKNR